MKKSISGLCCALFLCGSIYSQPFNFSYLTGTYTYLSPSTSCNNGLTWDDPNYTIPLGFNFQYFGQTIDTIKLSLGLGGTLLTSLNSSAIASFISPFGSDLIDRGYSFTSGPGQTGSLSNISYQTTGGVGSRIFKLEWKNSGFYSELSSNGSNSVDSVNFQLWLYEGSNIIEIHFGPSNVQSPLLSYDGATGPDIVLVPQFNLNNSSFTSNYYSLSGQPTNPTFLTVSPNSNYQYMLNTVPNGTIYRFDPNSAATDDYKVEELKIYPQPASSFIILEGATNFSYKIFNLEGKEVQKGQGSNGVIKLENQKYGAYILEIDRSKKVLRKKILIDP